MAQPEAEMLVSMIYRQVSFNTISLSHDLQIYTTFWIYLIIFGLTWFGSDTPWLHLPSVEG